MACAAIRCKNRPSNRVNGITFHRFPKDVHRQRQWVLALRRANWMPTKHSLVCSNHFEEDSFDRCSTLRTYIKPNAVPTIFDGYSLIANQKFLKSKTEEPLYPVKLEFNCVEPFEDISNDKNRISVVPKGLDVQETLCNSNVYSNDQNRIIVVPEDLDVQETLFNSNGYSNDKNLILVVPEGLDVQETLCNSNGYNNDKKNVVIIKDKTDYKTILNCGKNDDNRVIIVSDSTNMKTEWCGNVREDSYPNAETNSYNPKFGVESCKSDIADHSKIKALISFDPEFYVRRIKSLEGKVKKLLSKKKLLHQTSRRRRRQIVALQKEVNKIKKNIWPPKCSTHPIFHVLNQGVND